MQLLAAIEKFLRFCANERQLSQHTLQAYAADLIFESGCQPVQPSRMSAKIP